jgi:hypothetical protein
VGRGGAVAGTVGKKRDLLHASSIIPVHGEL